MVASTIFFSFAAFMARGLQKPFAVFMQDCPCSQIFSPRSTDW